MATKLIKGIPLVLGDATYILPPANLATLETMGADLDKINSATTRGVNFELTDLMFIADFATACLQRNYPEMTRDFVSQHVGLENVMDVLQMCLDVSGLLRKTLESSADSSGEGQGLGESAGTASLPTS